MSQITDAHIFLIGGVIDQKPVAMPCLANNPEEAIKAVQIEHLGIHVTLIHNLAEMKEMVKVLEEFKTEQQKTQ